MRSLILTLVCVSVVGLVGCTSSGDKSATAGHEDPAVCDLPGQGHDQATVTAAKAEPSMAVYGGELKLPAGDAVPASKVVANPAEYKDKTVRITGKVASVCEKKGCWLRVTPTESVKGPSSSDIFIKFKDPPAGRLIPMEAVGHEVVIEGTLKEGKMSEAAARHFLEDGGASQEEINKIIGPQPQLVVQGPVVAIEGIEKAE